MREQTQQRRGLAKVSVDGLRCASSRKLKI
jgi:hypothetical protein